MQCIVRRLVCCIVVTKIYLSIGLSYLINLWSTPENRNMQSRHPMNKDVFAPSSHGIILNFFITFY